jgi:cell fate (sporulation/competence/biofilm development) regulator YlbF (YheA/YmcA/DUF963 family)
MDNQTINELEIASKSVVMNYARKFLKALAESPQFQEFEHAYQTFNQDKEAKSKYREMVDKQRLIRMMAPNAIDENELKEYQKLEDLFYKLDSVQQYIKAQEILVSLSQEIGDILSEATGLNFALATKVGGCCG